MRLHPVRAAACGFGLFALSVLASVGTAQPPGTVPPNLPDPTKASDKLKRILMPPKMDSPAKSGNIVAEKRAEPRLRGRVIAREKALAVIEMNGQIFVMPVGGEANGLKVLDITINGVTVEVGSAKDVLVLN